MSLTTMELFEKVDYFRLADQGLTLQSRVALHCIETIRDIILNPDDELDVTLAFGRDVHGVYFVKGTLTGSLSVTCQRCLKPLTLRVDSQCLLSPISKPFEAEALPTAYEPVMLEEGRWLNTHALIAEEILLNLPYVPKHTEACCEYLEPSSETVFEECERKVNPFHNLSDKLKKTREKS